ncbi:MAG: hypothetical protein P8X89_09620 [Reinekea sp.]
MAWALRHYGVTDSGDTKEGSAAENVTTTKQTSPPQFGSAGFPGNKET